MQTSDVGLTATVGDNAATNELKFELWFRRQTAGVTLTLQASSMAVKRSWLAEISCLLWKQAIQNRERRRSETALHCPSRHDAILPGRRDKISPGPADNLIHDRFVAISIAASAAGIQTITVLMFNNNKSTQKTDLVGVFM